MILLLKRPTTLWYYVSLIDADRKLAESAGNEKIACISYSVSDLSEAIWR